MMSQNRQSAIDRVSAETDYEVNVHAEMEIESIQRRLDELAGNQWELLLQLQREQLDLLARIKALTVETHRSSRMA